MAGATGRIEGIARERVDPWLAGNVPGAAPPFEYRLIAGGRSNLTFHVTTGDGSRIVLRRPPLGNILQSAHDVVREHRIISALHGTRVPVARPLAVCEDPAVNDAPFYVMEFVDGVVLRTQAESEQALSPAARAAAGRSLVDVLAELHRLDPDEVGLGTLGAKDGYAQRQLRRWYSQFEKSKTAEIPIIDEVHRRLTARVPEQERTSIVHGDFRLDNCILGRDGAVRAVLDWELGTLGDPLADVGLLLVYWLDPGEPDALMRPGAGTAAAGFPNREAVVQRYAERSGADLSALDFYVALGYWKLACIYEGIRARYRAGVMGDDGFSLEETADLVATLGQRALEYSERLH